MADPLFTSDPTPSQAATPPSTPENQDPYADQLNGIKNEQGNQKYNSVADALTGLQNAQQFIETLKAEKAAQAAELEALRAKSEQSASLEQIISKLNQQQTPPAEERPSQTQVQQPEAIEALVARLLDEKAQKSQAQANLDSVQSQLVTRFGDKAKEAIANKAKELGMTPEQIGLMAQQSPKAALALFGAVAPTSPKAPVSTVNSIAFQTAPSTDELAPPEKSLLSGAKTKDVVDYMAKIREHVYKKLQVEA